MIQGIFFARFLPQKGTQIFIYLIYETIISEGLQIANAELFSVQGNS